MALSLVPKPKQLQRKTGSLLLDAGIVIPNTAADFHFSVTQLADAFASAGVKLAVEATAPAVVFTVDTILAADTYRLSVHDKGITVVSGGVQGAFYAVQTLRQIIHQQSAQAEALELPLIDIEDSPRLPYRGMHLDVSRHFFDIEFIKKYIDLIALHKMNYFHWHLTDDQGWRIQIEKYPRLTDVGAIREGTVVGHTKAAGAKLDGKVHGGYYSQDEVREIVDYATLRHVTIVPEIDVPGHASAIIAAYPELGCGPRTKVKTHFGVFKHVLCPAEHTFAFLDDVFREVAALFPGPYIHIGGDEVEVDHWRQCSDCQKLMVREGIEDVRSLHGYFVDRAAKLVKGHGKTIIGWDEILEGDISTPATVMSWRGIAGGLHASSLGQHVIMTPYDSLYFDFYQSSSLDEPPAIHGLTRLRDVYAYEPIPEGIDATQRQHILGAQANVWTEYITDGESVERMVLPRMTALAEVLWSPPEGRSLDDFVRRIETYIPFLEDLGYRVSDSHYKPEVSAVRSSDGGFEVSVEVERGEVYYTLDGSLPDDSARRYIGPFSVHGKATVRARTYLKDRDSWFGDTRLTVDAHKALGMEVEFTNATDPQWNDLAEHTIVNGIIGSDRTFRYPVWVALKGSDLDAVIKFPEATEVSEVTLGVDASGHRRLDRPISFAVFGAGTDKAWQQLGSLSAEQVRSSGNRLGLAFDPQVVNRLRIVAENGGESWSAEHETMQPTTMFFDEIIVH
ncbi:MAG: beta-N-acetylhexosaminidase [Pseudomonadales bacterium]